MNRASIEDLGGGALVPTNPNALAIGGQFEQQAHVLAAQAKARVEARYVIALRRPRNMDDVRSSVLKECNRPSFAADKSAYYKKPIGDGAEGLGIRFAEMALAKMTNVDIATETIYEDEQRETVRVSVVDIETNVNWSLDVRITKTVERRKANDDGSFVSWRLNSKGDKVFTVTANDDDLLNKRGALISKAARTLALRIIPGDIQAEAETAIKATRLDTARKDPDAERRKLVDAFAELGIRAEHLIEFLGHPLDQCSPAELVELRSFYGAIDAGDTTWQAVLDSASERQAKLASGAKAAADRAEKRIAKDADKGKGAPPAADAGKGAAVDKSAESQGKTVDKGSNPQGPKTGDQAPAPKDPPPAERKPVDEPKTTPEASASGGAPKGAQVAGVQTATTESNAPTLEDALRAINAGDDGIAHDIARTLGEAAQRKVAEAMEARDSGGGTLPGFE